MIVTPQQMKSVEAEAFAKGISAATLMEIAAKGIASVIVQFYPTPGICRVFCGKGNNGGDAIGAAYYLAKAGWEIKIDCCYPDSEMSPLARENLHALRNNTSISNFSLAAKSCVILDGLLGLGASGEPQEAIANKIQEIEHLRQTNSAKVFSIDIPTGLDGLTGVPAKTCVQADVTITLGAAKAGLLTDTATHYVGRLACVPLPGLEYPTTENQDIITPELIKAWLPPRNFDSYKNKFGHTAIIAGSPGYFGAARLCCLGALHAGAGLVTLLTRPQNYPYLVSVCPPEVMVQIVNDLRDVLKTPYDSIAVGPGLVGESQAEIGEIIRMADCPVVVDAGAMDVLASSLKILRLTSAPRVLTPHPGEMERFYRKIGTTRAELVTKFVDEYPCVLLLKGARTVVAAPGKPLLYNTSGSPAMSTGGVGDVLTGVIGALIGQGLRPTQAASLGAWVCGRAAEVAVSNGESEESFSASMIPSYLGQAFQSLKLATY